MRIKSELFSDALQGFDLIAQKEDVNFWREVIFWKVLFDKGVDIVNEPCAVFLDEFFADRENLIASGRKALEELIFLPDAHLCFDQFFAQNIDPRGVGV